VISNDNGQDNGNAAVLTLVLPFAIITDY